MNSPSLMAEWFRVLAPLALEVGLIALGIVVVRRLRISAVWRRTFCQAGIVAILVVTVCELSGSARVLAGWARRTADESKAKNGYGQSANSVNPTLLNDSFRSDVAGRLAARRQNVADATRSPVAPERPPSTRQDSGRDLPSPAVASSGGTVPATAETSGLAPFVAKNHSATPVVETHNALLPGSWIDSTEDSMWVLWLGLIWIIGALLLAARAGLARCLFLLFRLRRRPVTDFELSQRVHLLSDALGMTRRVRLVESTRLAGPIAFGLIRPTVGLPPNFSTRFDTARQNAVLAHELAHLTAHDPAWYFLADLTAALLWWHPAVWWTRRQLHVASEMAADEASLLVADGPRVLAECLVELGARLIQPTFLGQLGVSGFRSHLGQRVQRLLHLEGRVWSPPRRFPEVLVKILGPMAVAAVVVLCTAWAAPQASMKGNSMKSMQQNWKRSLAAFALLATLNTRETSAAADPAVSPETGSANTAAELTKSNARQNQPQVALAADKLKANDLSARLLQAERERDLALRELSALKSGGAAAGNRASSVSSGDPKARALIETKLEQMVLPEVHFDGLPLSEVLLVLSEQARKSDPDRKGVNFLINNNVPPAAAVIVGPIDPATGLPTAAPQEQIDVASVSVKFTLPLRNVTFKQTLDAVAKVADHSIEYTVEDYGVIFSLKPEACPSQPIMSRTAATPELFVVRTYRVDTNNFLAGLENAFGIKNELPPQADSAARSRKIQSTLKELLTQLGLAMSSSKSVFYNDLTGIVMVRATPDDQEIVGAAMETLGGFQVSSYGGGGGGNFTVNVPGNPAR